MNTIKNHTNSETSDTETHHLHTALELQRKKEKLLEEIRGIQTEIHRMDTDIQKNLEEVFQLHSSRGKKPSTPAKTRRGPKPLTTRQKIENLLGRNPQGLSVKDIAKATKKSESHIYNSIKTNGHGSKKDILPVGKGRWGLTPQPTA